MNKSEFTYLLEHPEQLQAKDVNDLQIILEEYPFFQGAHALHLKGLKNQESFTYNKALKVVAAHTADRSVLFDYITSPVFEQNATSEAIKNQELYLLNIAVNQLEDLSKTVVVEEQDNASKILDPNLFIPKTNEEKVQLGKPLHFDKTETHSFIEWLQLSSIKPIKREESQNEDEKTITAIEKIEVKPIQENTNYKSRKLALINSFIEANPKIEIKTPVSPTKKNLAKEQLIPAEALMTETLARVYIEQKNYKKAKKAYRILSLKYPEKSGFFADQIRAVEELELKEKQ